MKQPECPPAGKVIVLSSSFFAEWKPDIVPEMFDSVKDAQDWIKQKLEEEPGDLYVICSVLEFSWAEIQVKTLKRKSPRR